MKESYVEGVNTGIGFVNFALSVRFWKIDLPVLFIFILPLQTTSLIQDCLTIDIFFMLNKISPNSLWEWINLVSNGGSLVLYIVGKLIPLDLRISMLEDLKVSFKRVIALHRRVSVLGSLIFSDDIHNNYYQTCYF